VSDALFHSVRLDPEKCVGCTTCIKHCPTEAIRVREGRAHIIEERCIDCGECIRVCPHGAKRAVSDPLSVIEGYRYRVAVPAPTLFSQFDRASVDQILSGLLQLGFDEVFEVAEAAEIVSAAEKALLAGAAGTRRLPRPVISSACPAVVRLVRLRFPSLIPHLAPLLPPMEVAARIVKERLRAGTEGVGVFFITPCAGKVTVTRSPLGYGRSALDGVIGLRDVFLPLRAAIASAPRRELARATRAGLEWARSEGEAEALGEPRSISVDGIGNVIGVLEELENAKLEGLAYIEALACPAGCLGGPLTVENPYVAKARLRDLESAAPAGAAPARAYDPPRLDELSWTADLGSSGALALDPDSRKALRMMEEIEETVARLPGLDCGACGAPTCRALAEDMEIGAAGEFDCVLRLKERFREMSGDGAQLTAATSFDASPSEAQAEGPMPSENLEREKK
jgi:iron only hydrogenase large subunit-like protein